MSNDNLLKANFPTKMIIEKDDVILTPTEQYEKKALENVSGSMVFCERTKLLWDKK